MYSSTLDSDPPPPPIDEFDSPLPTTNSTHVPSPFRVATGSRFDEDAGWESEEEEEEEEERKHTHQLASPTYAEIRLGSPSPSSSASSLSSSSQRLTQRHITQVNIEHATNRRRRSNSSSSSSSSGSDWNSDSSRSQSHSRRKKKSSRGSKKEQDDSGHEDSDEEDEDEEPDDSILKPLPPGMDVIMRIAMCVLSLVLLWVTSLSLATYITSSVVGSPQFEPVFDGWRAAFEVADKQAAVHSECVTILAAECDRRLNQSIVTSETQWQESERKRKAALLEVETTAQTCDETSTQILQGISTWMGAGAMIQYEEQMCTPAEVEALRTLLKDHKVNKDGLNGLTQNYVATTGAIFDDTALQVTVLQDYNSQFVLNQTEESRMSLLALDASLRQAMDPQALLAEIDMKLAQIKSVTSQLVNCVGRANQAVNSICPTGTLIDSYNALLASLRASYAQLQSLGADSIRQLNLYGASVKGKFDEVQRFFNLLYPLADALGSIGINVLSMPSLTDVPNIIPNPAFVNALANAVDLPEIGPWFESRVQVLQAKWQQEYDQARAEMLGYGSRVYENVSSALSAAVPSNPLSQYHPPPIEVRMDALRMQLDQTAEVYKQQSSEGIDNLLTVVSSVPISELLNSTLLPDAINTTGMQFTSPQLSQTDFSLNIASFSGSFEFSSILVGLITAMGGVFVLGDIVYRNLLSVRLIYKYIKEPQDMLPTLDARTKENKQAAESAKGRGGSFCGKVVLIMQHPLLLTTLLSILLIWLLALFLAVYIPAYQAYEQGCTAGRETTDGGSSTSTSSTSSEKGNVDSKSTFLSQNSFVLLYNYASVRGNTDLLIKLTKYESQRALACGREQEKQMRASSENSVDLSVQLSKQQQAYSNLHLVEKCLASLDLPFGIPAPTIDPRLLFTVGLVQGCEVDAAAQAGYASLFASNAGASASQAFNCSFLPTCDAASTCPGPDILAIKSSSYDSSCRTEYTLHQCVFYFAFVGLIFLCLNLSRLFAIRAMVRLGWKALAPKGLTFMATCDHEGRVVSQGEEERKRKEEDSNNSVDSSSSSDEDSSPSKPAGPRFSPSGGVTKSILKRHIAAYEDSATNFLVLTLAVHIPYLLLLLVLKDPVGWGSTLKIAQPKLYGEQ